MVKFGFFIQKTNIDTHKIDDNTFETFRMIIASLMMEDKDRNFYSFKRTFPLTDISINLTFRILFFMMSNVKINFNN